MSTDAHHERDGHVDGRGVAAPDTSGLEPFRRRLDFLDGEIVRLLGERFDVCRAVARYKSEHEIPMMQPDRVAHVRARYLERGAAADLPREFCAELFELLIGATCRLEDELMGNVSSPPHNGNAVSDNPARSSEGDR